MQRVVLALAALVLGAAGRLPDWVDTVTGTYNGRIRNAGVMECFQTEFFVADGALQGRYHVEADEPFDGTLTGFNPDPPGEHPPSGTFVWTDRYGTGVQWISFAPSHQSFVGRWGALVPSGANVSWGTHGPVAGCGSPVS